MWCSKGSDMRVMVCGGGMAHGDGGVNRGIG